MPPAPKGTVTVKHGKRSISCVNFEANTRYKAWIDKSLSCRVCPSKSSLFLEGPIFSDPFLEVLLESLVYVEDNTYIYVCCEECRQVFETNPVAYE